MPKGHCKRCGEELNTGPKHAWHCDNEDCEEYVDPSDINWSTGRFK